MSTVQDITLHEGLLLLFKFRGTSGALAALSSILMIIQIHIVVSELNPLSFSIKAVYALTAHQRKGRYHHFFRSNGIHLSMRWTEEACIFLDNLSGCQHVLMTITMASK